MAKKLDLDYLSEVNGGQQGSNGINFVSYTQEQVKQLKIGDCVSVLRNSMIYQSHVYMESFDNGATIDVRGGGLPNDLAAARYYEVGPEGQTIK